MLWFSLRWLPPIQIHWMHFYVIAKLNTLRQGRRSFQELLTEFDRLLLEAGGYGWVDTVKKGYLRAAINNELRERLITMMASGSLT
jgi:hypothetical protein